MIKKLSRTPKSWLTLDDCERAFKNFRDRLGKEEPIPPFHTRFEGKLESILASVRQTVGRQFVNATVLDATAAYFNQLTRGHPLQNGNKRMAVLFTHLFLLRHKIDFTLTYGEMVNFAIEIASAGEKGISYETTKQWCAQIIAEFTMERK